MAYRRRTKKGEQPEQNDPILQPEQLPRTLSDTDKLFAEYRPGYYDFDTEVWNKSCPICKKEFKTSLELLKFCSPECQKQVFVMIATNGNPDSL